VKERFQNHLGLPKARIEVVVERIELFPAGGGINGQPGRNIVGVLFELHPEMLDGVREDAKLVKETGAVPEQHVVEKTVPGCCALSGVSPEEFRMQRLDERKVGYVLSAFGKYGARAGESRGEAEEKVGSDRHLLLGTDQLAARPPCERFIKGHTQHRVRAFPFANGILENLILLPWERSAPIIGCVTSDGGGDPPSFEQHVPPKGSAL
jgi:hypothetical protein